MNNKVLVKVYVPTLDSSYDVFIPVNELVWKANKLIVKSISDLNQNVLDIKEKYIFINKVTCQVYGSNEIIRDTDIRNGTELVLLRI